ncbi:MAG: sulfite exporter TauE/SafE family protein [Pseudomonadota bacterium]
MPGLIDLLLLTSGAFLAGIVTGLTGFGTGLTAMALWLYVVSPLVAAPLVALCSLSVHVLTIRRIWPEADARGAVPYVLGALIFIPAGIGLLTILKPDVFRILIGLVLIGFPLFILFSGRTIRIEAESKASAGAVGAVSGLFGGFAGLSGPPLVIWSQLCAWPKEKARGLLQIINMAVLGVAVIGYAVGGLLTPELMNAALVCLPASMLGGWLGLKLYARVNSETFRKIVLVLLIASGLGLVIPKLL